MLPDVERYGHLEKTMGSFAEERELLYDFIDESNKTLDWIGKRLADPATSATGDTMQACLRFFQGVKNGAGILGFGNIFELARTAEIFLDHLCRGSIPMRQEYFHLVDEICGFFKREIQELSHEFTDDFLADSSGKLIEKIYRLTGLEKKDEKQVLQDDILESFVWEVDDLLASAEQEFVLWEDVAGDAERLTELHRIFHRLKENFSFYGYEELLQLSQVVESLLNRYLNGDVFVGQYPEQVFLQAIDRMRDAVALLAHGGEEKVANLSELMENLETVMRVPLGELLIRAGFVGVQTVERALRVQEEALARNEQPPRLGEVLVEMGEVSSDQVSQALSRQQQLAESGAGAAVVGEMAVGREPRIVKDVLVRRDVLVDGNRLQRLQDTLGRMHTLLMEAQGSLPQPVTALMNELQKISLSLNTVPVRHLVPRMNRLVHDLALRSGKKVVLRVIGEEIELERDILEYLGDPLVHLLRNGIDHGIESPERRKNSGKDEQGRLTLSVLRRKDEIWASIEDDGAGLDLNKIIRRAIELGLMEADDSKPDSRQIAALIFKFGFTTADRITDSSGRGIGMDAVKKSLRQLGGRVDVFSRPGKGTRVTLRVPTGACLPPASS